MTRKLLGLAALLALLGTLSACAPLAVTGAAVGAVMASDRRTTGMYVEDENIEWKVIALVNDKFKAGHVNATSYNRKVLLTGEVSSEEAKKELGTQVKAIASVVDVTNEVQVAGNASLGARGNDSLLTTNVKARMVNNGKFSPGHVKVVTEAGTVYLMGIVSTEEGDAAAEIARTTSGVRGVVKVFEYLK